VEEPLPHVASVLVPVANRGLTELALCHLVGDVCNGRLWVRQSGRQGRQTGESRRAVNEVQDQLQLTIHHCPARRDEETHEQRRSVTHMQHSQCTLVMGTLMSEMALASGWRCPIFDQVWGSICCIINAISGGGAY
jgi:hypothetical protein